MTRIGIGIRGYLEDSLGVQNAELFAEWAWGDTFKTISFQRDGVRLWNERHANKLRLSGSGNRFYDLKQMIEIWKKENCKDLE